MDDNVVHVKPKKRQLKYKRQTIVLEYKPDKMKWRWTVEYNVPKSMSGFADTMKEAEQEAKSWLDQALTK